jgi:phenylpyruvate tautomerase PptA (4-oxalocrotonate tautomerase family)
MPYLKLTTNAALSSQNPQELLGCLSKLLAQETGKPERYVLVEACENESMLFAGSDEPLAYLECKSIGLTTNQAKSLSAAIAHILSQKLKIQGDRVYIEFSNCPGEFWGWNGSTFG